MKKLMIAAAAAALIGGAQADLVYDFSASLKTTTAKASTQSTTYSYYFGFAKDASGKYWWADDKLIWDVDNIYASWKVDGNDQVIVQKLIKRDSKSGKGTIQSSVWNKLDQAVKLQFVKDFGAYGNYYYPNDPEKSVTNPAFFNTEVAAALQGVQEVYGGKKQWCMSIKWSNKVTNTSCYRVAGSVKLAGKYVVAIDNCCDPNTEWTADWSKKGAQPAWIYDEAAGANVYNVNLFPILSYRFGALTLEKATKAEFVAQIGDVTDAQKLPQLTIAGQGSVATVKDKTGAKSVMPQIKSISGNVAGVWLDPVCTVCCGNNGDAVVFDCAEDATLWDGMGGQPGRASKDITANVDDPDYDIRGNNAKEPIWQRGFVDVADNGDLWGTAAWGTFTLKYVEKESTFVNP